MQVTIQRLNTAFHLEATNEQGNTVSMDASPDIGGQNLGFRPMQMLLAGIGGCSSIDVLDILRKQRQEVRDLTVIVDGQRVENQVPAVFEKIHLHFVLKGNIEPDKAARAINLSMEKYCSVTRMLEKTAVITYDFEINE
ncbi:MAG: OsmC family protein [Microscillaceae bacterium]|nr:OsmC family protein [Microscillaceae bacterium]